jgi:hypothetical protein
MCNHEHDQKEERRTFLKMLGSAMAGLVAMLMGVEASEAAEVCGAKCISSPYDGGTCSKPKSPFHQFHKCSKGHSW